MVVEDGQTFGDVLKHYRGMAGLTQEALAERAGLSRRGLSDLERGINKTPRADTVHLLARALGLSGDDRDLLEAAARRHGVLRPRVPRVPIEAPPRLGPASLPIPPTPLVGRTAETQAMYRALRRGDVRLVTLTGPGGVGKTRLALQAANDLRDDFADGVVFVPLAACCLADLCAPVAILPTIARAAGFDAHTVALHEQDGCPLAQCLTDFLSTRHMLLILDNFEHLLAAAPDVADLLASCPGIKILVTSRAPLHIRGEHELVIPPLGLPADEMPTMDAATESPAVALFAQRLQAVRPDWTPTPRNMATVVEICRRLDGLPLAIELAAARGKYLSPQALLARLQSRLEVLVGGARDLPERQQTLRDTIAWSYEILDAEEQRLFRRLCVFAGGFSPAAVAAICGDGPVDGTYLPGDGSIDDRLFARLESLADQSMIRASGQGEDRERFAILETIREFGKEQLIISGELDDMQRRHAAYYAALAERAEPELQRASQVWWLECLETEHANLRAALQWTIQSGHVELGLRLAGAAWRFWYLRGYYGEALSPLTRLLEMDQEAAHAARPAIRAKALAGGGALCYNVADSAQAIAYAEEALALYEALGDKDGMARAINTLANVAHDHHGDLERAVLLHSRGLELRREIGDAWGQALSLQNLGVAVQDQGDLERAADLFAQSLALRDAVEDRGMIAGSLCSLAEVRRRQGEIDEAGRLFEEGAALYRDIGFKSRLAHALSGLGHVARARDDLETAARLHADAVALYRERWITGCIGNALLDLGDVLREQGDLARAGQLYAESLDLQRQRRDTRGIAASLRALASLAHEQDQPERAVRLLGAAAALGTSDHAPHGPEDAPSMRLMASLRARLGDRFSILWAAGQAVSLDRLPDITADEVA